MDEHSLLVIMAVFVVVASLALVIQAGMLFGIYRASKAMKENADRLTPKVEALVESSKITVDESRTQIQSITTKANDILDSARTQMVRVDELMTDVAARTRRQMDHAEVVLDDAMDRAQETIASVQGGVMKPIREISAVAAGIRAGFHYLMRGGRPSPDQVTVDEEMFI